jgi:hypothetical protein
MTAAVTNPGVWVAVAIVAAAAVVVAVAVRWPHVADRWLMTEHHNDEAAQLLRQTDGER